MSPWRTADPVTERVRAQYERHPYPPVSPFALPGRRPEAELTTKLGASLAGRGSGPERPRLLVAGCGSLEALVVARANPDAREVVAVDASLPSLRMLERRVQLARFLQPFAPLAPITTRHQDLADLDGGPFDVVYLSNVLQHVGDPARILGRIASRMAPGGLLRLVVYPRTSRVWMRAIQAHLRALGLGAASAAPRSAVHAALAELPAASPLRLTFDAHPEAHTDAGVVDAFLHSHDDPVALDALGAHLERLGFVLVAERQTDSSRGAFVADVDPAVAARVTDAWQRLALLDDSLELCANPVLWCALDRAPVEQTPSDRTPRPEVRTPLEAGALRVDGSTLRAHGSLPESPPEGDLSAVRSLVVPSPIGAHLSAAFSRVEQRLRPLGLPADAWLSSLAREVGPRFSAPPAERCLPGLALSDYPPDALRGHAAAVPDADLRRLGSLLAEVHGLAVSPDAAPPSMRLDAAVTLLAARSASVLEPVRVPLVRASSAPRR